MADEVTLSVGWFTFKRASTFVTVPSPLLFVPDHIDGFFLDFEVGPAEEFAEKPHH